MRRHPFFGIIVPKPEIAAVEDPQVSPGQRHARRSFLARVAAVLGGGFGLWISRPSRAQDVQIGTPATTPSTASPSVIRVPRGGDIGPAPGTPPPGTVTTFAIGEEGGSFPRPPSPGTPPPGNVTTYAIGEEGGSYPRPSPPPGTVTTQALGEEGSGTVTTQALGEEGSGGYTPRRRSFNRSPRYWYRY